MTKALYTNLTIGASERLASLRRTAATHSNREAVKSWRDVRYSNLRNPSKLDAGFNGEGRSRVPVWYGFDSFLRRETWCDEVEGIGRAIDHTGWFTDTHQSDKARGFIVALPHGKFLAGYHLSMNDERVYFADIHDSARDAALMADEHARVIAEAETEHAEKFDAATDLESEIEQSLKRLRECIVLRHTACLEYVRDEISELCESIREKREDLATNFKGVL